jgi:hypothetical protein
LKNSGCFLREIRIKGIREIRGDLLLDRTFFDAGDFDAALFDGDPLRPYNVGPDALLLNFKSIGFRFIPNEAAGAVAVLVDPPINGDPVIAPKPVEWRVRRLEKQAASRLRRPRRRLFRRLSRILRRSYLECASLPDDAEPVF